MKQIVQIEEKSVCGNNKFRSCSVDQSTYQCVNCDKRYTDNLHEGDKLTGNCRSCDRENIEVTVAYTYEGNAGYIAECQDCAKSHKAIDELYDDFRGEGYGYEKKEDGETTDYTTYTSEKFQKDREEALEKIVNLSKEDLKVFLRDIHQAVER